MFLSQNARILKLVFGRPELILYKEYENVFCLSKMTHCSQKLKCIDLSLNIFNIGKIIFFLEIFEVYFSLHHGQS